ncbi:MAG: hypothetical protein B7Z80_19450, partial [Rhodospirillales bacterium 20-64-7]
TFSGGTFLVFAAMFGLGFMGETRRLDYLYDTSWFPLLVVEEIGIGVYCLSLLFFVAMIFLSIRDRKKHPAAPDAWGTSRTLEWMTRTPVPFYNFAVTPHVNARDELAWRRQNGVADIAPDHYEAVHMPNNSLLPFMMGVMSFLFGFGMVWRIWWMAALGIVVTIALVIVHSFSNDPGYVLSAEDIERMEGRATPLSIVDETPAPAILDEVKVH